MQIELTEFIEFSKDKASYVTFIGNVTRNAHDGTHCDIDWDSKQYTEEENKMISCASKKMYDKFYDAFEDELKELLIESEM